MSKSLKILCLSILALNFATTARASSFVVTTNADGGQGSLRQALIDATIQSLDPIPANSSITNPNHIHTISFDPSVTSPITLSSPLPALVNTLNVTIDGTSSGSNVTIDGGGNFNAFWVYDGILNVNNLNIQNCVSKGGKGGNGAAPGGGGLGAGGAVFVNNLATVSLNNVNIDGSQAIAGDPGNVTGSSNTSAGGGGGINGNGGNSDPSSGGFGGGGGVNGNGGDGINANSFSGSGGGGGVNGNGGNGTGGYGGGGGFCADGGSGSKGGNGGGGGIGIGANGGNSYLPSVPNYLTTGAGGGGGGINAPGGSVTGTGAGGGGGYYLAGNSNQSNASGQNNSGSGSASGGQDVSGGSNNGGSGGASGSIGGSPSTGIGGSGGTGNGYTGTSYISTNYGGGAGGGGQNYNSGTGVNYFTPGGTSLYIGGAGASGIGGDAAIGGGGGGYAYDSTGTTPTSGNSSKMGGSGGLTYSPTNIGIGGSGGTFGFVALTSGFGGGKGGMVYSDSLVDQRPGFGGGQGGTVSGDTGPAQSGQAYGGAVFVRGGGNLSLNNVNITNSSVTQSSPASPGIANPGGTGDAMYFHANSSNPSGLNNATFGADVDQTISNAIEGHLILNKIGNGTLTLTANNGYLGGSIIDAGTLVVNGSISSAYVQINSGGTLKGTGTLNSVNSSGGTISPGNSIGTINIGYLSSDKDTIFDIEINPNATSSMINVTGNANINGGKIKLYPDAGIYVNGTTYTIMQFGAPPSHSGSLMVSNGDPIGLGITLNYSPSKLTLTVSDQATNFGSNLVYIPSGICTEQNCVNSQNYLIGLSSASITSLQTTFDAISALPSDTQKLSALSDLLGGRRKGSVTTGFSTQSLVLGSLRREFSKTQFNNSSYFTNKADIKAGQLEELKLISAVNIKKDITDTSGTLKKNHQKRSYLGDNHRKSSSKFWDSHPGFNNLIFSSIYGRQMEEDSQYQLANNSTTFGFVVGDSLHLSDEQKLTISSAYVQNTVNYLASKGNSRSKHLLLGVNYAYENPIYQVNTGINLGASRYQDLRQLSIGTVTQAASSSHLAGDLGIYAELSQNIYLNKILMKPKIGIELFGQFHQGYMEKNIGSSISGLNFKKQLYAMTKISMGTEFTKVIKFKKAILMPSIGIGYGYSKNLNKNIARSGFLIDDSFVALANNSYDKNEFDLNLNLVAKLNEKTSMTLQYDGTFKKYSTQHELGLGFEIKL